MCGDLEEKFKRKRAERTRRSLGDLSYFNSVSIAYIWLTQISPFPYFSFLSFLVPFDLLKNFRLVAKYQNSSYFAY